jgi:hypothetical protein
VSSAASTKGRERQEKILQAMYKASGGTTKVCAYETIVVEAWKLWPEEFGLRGYVHEYPDSSDLHKPLYGPLKRDGFVRSPGTKKFGLTERGLAAVERIKRGPDSAPSQRGRLQRDEKAEILRLADRPAIRMLANPDDLLDTDLYDFYGVTVRTKPAEFAGRLRTVDAAVDAAVMAKDPSIDLEKVAMVVATRDALINKFAELLSARSAVKEKTRS